MVSYPANPSLHRAPPTLMCATSGLRSKDLTCSCVASDDGGAGELQQRWAAVWGARGEQMEEAEAHA